MCAIAGTSAIDLLCCAPREVEAGLDADLRVLIRRMCIRCGVRRREFFSN
jgi:hypothetical protein